MSLFYLAERLSGGADHDRSVPGPRDLRLRFRAPHPTNDEHPDEDLFSAMRRCRHGPDSFRIRTHQPRMQRRLLPLREAGRSVQVSGHRQELGLVRDRHNAAHYVRVPIAVLHWPAVALLHVTRRRCF